MDQNHALQAKHLLTTPRLQSATKRFLARYARRVSRQELHVQVTHGDDCEYPLMQRCE